MASTNFYSQIPPFSDFHDVTEPSHFRQVPQDWWMIITDVRNSTGAVAKGRYKDVNLIGVACISTVQNALKQTPFPFVFGGDGATLLVPPDAIDVAKAELGKLISLADVKFDLSLRVGAVPVSTLVQEGVTVEVARYQLKSGRSIAIIRGGGLSLAERWVKSEDARRVAVTSSKESPSLEGLSCRWNPIPSKRGCVLALLAQSQGSVTVYQKVLAEISQIVGQNLEGNTPINLDEMSYLSFANILKNEARFYRNPLGVLNRLLSIVLSVFIFRWGFPNTFKTKHYLEAIPSHSDSKKFDDMLRMLIDCTPMQAEQIEKRLAKLHESGELYYGLQKSKNSLMTCFVTDLSDGNHIHFIDGEDGGYSKAAIQLKAQMKGRRKAA